MGAQTRDWEDKTVATKCSKCGKARKTVPVEGKTMTAAATRDASKTPLTMENVQEAVVKAPAAAAFAGIHKYERGNGFGLGEHTAYGASAEGVTADEASPGGVGTGQINDTSLRRGQNKASTITQIVAVVGMMMGMFTIPPFVGDMETEVVSMLRWIAVMIICGAACCTWAWGAAAATILKCTSALIIFCGAGMSAWGAAEMSAIYNTSYS